MNPSRRKFLKTAIVSATSIGSGLLLPDLLAQNPVPPEGEEWRWAEYIKEEGLRPQSVVLHEAHENIQKIRKGELRLHFAGKGYILDQKQIKLTMRKHYFDWGCSSLPVKKSFTDPDVYRYWMHNFTRLFKASTAKCYWDERWHQPIEKIEGERILDRFLAEVETGVENGLKMKGHPLVWTIPKGIPEWMKKYTHDERVKIWEDHVKDLVMQGGDNIHNWDVVNEMLWEPTFKNIYQRDWPHIDPVEDIADYVALSLKWVREVNPVPLRLINDYGLIKEFNRTFSVKDQRVRYVKLVEGLRERGELPHAIGVQGHVGKWFHPDEVVATLNELAKCGLPIHITEFWARMNDCPFDVSNMSQEKQDQLLTQYLTDFYTVAFGHPAIEHLTYWGNPFLTSDGSKTFMFDALDNLINHEWSTKGSFQTDPSGNVATNAFYGTYEIVLDGKSFQVDFTPDYNGKKIVVELG